MTRPRSTFSFFLFLTLFLSLSLLVSSAEAKSFWDALMGRSGEEEGPPPEVTLQAPFIDPKQQEAASKAPMMDIYKEGNAKATESNTLDITQPHLSPEAIATWSGGIVVEAMSFSPDTFSNLQTSIASNFSPYGLQEYQTYLQRSGVLGTLEKNNLKLISITDVPPQVLREGVVSGTYHWLVQVPVMTSFYDQKFSKIVDKSAKVAQNQKITVQVQVGRTQKKDANELGIEIERWIIVAN